MVLTPFFASNDVLPRTTRGKIDGKRAVFFTLASIFFVAALVLIFRFNQTVDPIDTKTAMVYTADQYRDKLEVLYIPLLAKHYSYNSLYAMSTEAYTRPIAGYLVFPQDYNDTIMTGSLRGVPIAGFTTLPQALANLSAISAQLGYNLSIVTNSISIAQSGPFQASYTVNMTFNLSTKDGSVRYQRNVTSVGVFSLLGLPDLTYNRLTPVAGPMRVLQPYQPVAWNNAEFPTFVNGGYYRINNESPSFFGRLQGNFSRSTWGVESAIPSSFTPANNLTSIDWQYFQGIEYGCTYEPQIPAGMRLSLESTFDYNLSSTTLRYNGGACIPGP